MVDASVAIKWLLNEPGSSQARSFLERFRSGIDDLVAPDLMVSEIGNALRSAASIRERIPSDLALLAMADYLAIGIPTRPAAPTAEHTLGLALQYNSTYYDASYVSLAMAEERHILSTDGPMTRKFGSVVSFVQVEDK